MSVRSSQASTGPGSDSEQGMRFFSSRELTSDTFDDSLSITLDEPVGSMSLSPSNRDICLGARKGLFIVDLASPFDTPRFLPGLSTWEVADVQWNIHPARAQWIVSTSGHQALVWNIAMDPASTPRDSAIEFVLNGHTRSVTDVNWSIFDPDVVATCALDSWVMTWDMRTGGKKPASSYSGWRAGATQVKWNRQNSNMLASAHDGRILVWDQRKGSNPVHTVLAHETKIYGLDWSRKSADEFVTCSLDKTIKSWRLPNIDSPQHTIESETPIWRARYLPFGDGILSLPQRWQTALTVWDEASSRAVHQFEGHRDVCKEFVWRTRGGQNSSNDDRDFQLVTWGKDRQLRLWPISESLMESVGHVKGGPIKFRMTRRGYDYVSFRQLDGEHHRQLPRIMKAPSATLSPMAYRGHAKRKSTMSSSSPSGNELFGKSPLARQSPMTSPLPITSAPPASTAGHSFVIRGVNRLHGQLDPVAWMEGVKRVDSMASPNTLARPLIDSSPRSTVISTAPSQQQAVDAAGFSLGEELASAGRKYASRINFEKVQVAGRRCTVSCYGPWGPDNIVAFIRVTFLFPPNYPTAAIKAEAAAEIGHRTRIKLHNALRKAAAKARKLGKSGLEECLQCLLGESVLHSIESREASSESDDDEPYVTQRIHNLPQPRRCGVAFGVRDQLVHFAAATSRGRPVGTSETIRQTSASPFPTARSSTSGLRGSVSSEPVKKRRRVFESFGVLPIDRAGEQVEEDASESDDVLRFSSVITSTVLSRRRASLADDAMPFPKQASIVHIRYLPNLTCSRPDLAADYSLPDGGDVFETCQANFVVCANERNAFLAMVWATLADLLKTPKVDDEKGGEKQLVYSRHSMPERALVDILTTLRWMRDVQTLGLVACCIESRRRDILEARRLFISRRELELSTSTPDVKSALRSDRLLTPDVASVATPGQITPLQRSSQSFFSLPSALFNLGGLKSSGSPTSRSRTTTVDEALVSPTPGPSSIRSRQLSASSSSLPRSDGSAGSPVIRPARTSAPPPLLARRTSRPPTRAGATVKFGGTSVIAPEAVERKASNLSVRHDKKRITVSLRGQEDDSLYRLPAFLLSDQLQAELECHRFAYAELLHRYGEHTRRAEVLALTTAAHQQRAGSTSLAVQLAREASGLDAEVLIFVEHCRKCMYELRDGRCGRCLAAARAVGCVVCHQPVRGLSQTCFSCLHVGHVECWSKWSGPCPAGCQCQCWKGGLSGLSTVAPI